MSNWERLTDNIRIYHPNGLMIPPELNLEREKLPITRGSRRERQKPHDRTTILYDLFLDRNKNKIVALAPDPLNLEEHLFPVEVTYKNNPLQFKKLVTHDYNKNVEIIALEIDVDGIELNPNSKLKFKWATFESEVPVTVDYPQDISHKMSIVTLQKDNPPAWVSDWIKYHHRVHGVSRAIIYDNNSDNYAQLISHLAKNISEVEVIVVNWKYLFGPPCNLFAPMGFHNHCYRMFGEGKYYIKLDVDEYLVNRTALSLEHYLARAIKGNVVAINIPGGKVPNQSGATSIKDLRVYHFLTKYRRRVGSNRKVIYTPHNIDFVAMHYAVSSIPGWARVLSNSKICRGILRRFNLPIPGWYFEKLVPDSELYFNHYSGLTTGWKSESRLMKEEFDAELHEKDRFMEDLFKKIGLSDGTAGGGSE